jgi:hypothetical protein
VAASREINDQDAAVRGSFSSLPCANSPASGLPQSKKRVRRKRMQMPFRLKML